MPWVKTAEVNYCVIKETEECITRLGQKNRARRYFLKSLTSIDKDHRRHVGELLLSEFKDFQIILTTHDDHWSELLQSSARAMGLQNQWQYEQINGWTVDSGPVLSVSDNSWEFITENLTEANFWNLGGPFRVVLEDFLARSAAKIELKVRF